MLCIILAIFITNRNVLASHINFIKDLNITKNEHNVNYTGIDISTLVSNINSGQVNRDNSSNATTTNELNRKHLDQESGDNNKTDGLNTELPLSKLFSGPGIVSDENGILNENGEDKKRNLNDTMDIDIDEIYNQDHHQSENNEFSPEEHDINLYDDPLIFPRQSGFILISNKIQKDDELENHEQIIPERNSRLFKIRRIERHPNEFPYINPFIPIENKITGDESKDLVASTSPTLWTNFPDISEHHSDENDTDGTAVETEMASQPVSKLNAIMASYIIRSEKTDYKRNETSKLELASTSLIITNMINSSNKTEEQN